MASVNTTIEIDGYARVRLCLLHVLPNEALEKLSLRRMDQNTPLEVITENKRVPMKEWKPHHVGDLAAVAGCQWVEPLLQDEALKLLMEWKTKQAHAMATHIKTIAQDTMSRLTSKTEMASAKRERPLRSSSWFATWYIVIGALAIGVWYVL